MDAGCARHTEDPGRTWTWVLPDDATCARTARSLLRAALRELGVPEEAADDAALMVSELATNAHQHAEGRLPHELWLDHLDAYDFRCAVFDGMPGRAEDLAFERGDFGRGLSIVAELSKGRWGTVAATSRVVPAARGKAVWFLCCP